MEQRRHGNAAEGPCNGAMSGATGVHATVSWSRRSGQGRPDTYTWTASGGVSISGSTSGSSVTIRGDTVGQGQVQVTVTCTNGSQDDQTRNITVAGFTPTSSL